MKSFFARLKESFESRPVEFTHSAEGRIANFFDARADIYLSISSRTLRRMRRRLLAVDALIDFFAVNGDIFRRIDADAYLSTLHPDDGHGDIVADHQPLAHFPCQYQHGRSSAFRATMDADAGIGFFTNAASNCVVGTAPLLILRKS